MTARRYGVAIIVMSSLSEIDCKDFRRLANPFDSAGAGRKPFAAT